MQSVGNKLDDLEIFLTLKDIDVMCISETWCGTEWIQCFNIPGYTLANFYCRTLNKHGGVAILVKNSLNYERMHEVDKCSIEKVFEVTCIKLCLANFEVCIMCIYRSPSASAHAFLHQFEQCLTFILTLQNCNIIVMGDLNIDSLVCSHSQTLLSDLLCSYCLTPAFSLPTRVTSTTSTAIDYICTNFDNLIVGRCVDENGLSDHRYQLIELPVSENISQTYCKSYSFSFKNQKQFTNYLNQENWFALYSEQNNADQAFKIFSESMEYYYNISFINRNEYCRKSNKNKSKPWLTIGLKTSSKNIKQLHIQAKQGLVTAEYYKKYKQIYRRLLRSAKRKFSDNKIINSKNKSRTVWNLINATIKKPVNKSVSFLHESREYTDFSEIANLFNNYFVNIPKKIENANSNIQFSDSVQIHKTTNTLYLYPVHNNEVLNAINELKNTTSCGYDGFSTNIIKSNCRQLCGPLTHLINISFSSGIFPDALKISKVITLHKKGNAKDIKNYRPISLLSVFSKIYERLLYKRIYFFLESHKLISGTQHGFRAKHSTISALCSILDNVYGQLDSGNKVIAAMVDLTKAFDCVNHECLLSKLETYGIRGLSNNLLRSYLNNRRQFVEFNGKKSSNLNFETGVPQGSVLGPLLFILYINDISSALLTYHCEFADDVTLIACDVSADAAVNNLSNSLDKLSDYLENNSLSLNSTKTTIMQFYPQKCMYNQSNLIRLKGRSLQQVTSTKLLGLHIDMTLKWTEHIDYMCKKIAPNCYALHRLRQIAGKDAVKTFYSSNIESYIRYGIILWGGSSAANRIFKLQKRAIRCMFGMGYRDSCREIFMSESILTLPSLFILEILKYVKMNKMKFKTLNITHTYSTRYGQNLQFERHKLELYKHNPNYIGAVLYNKIPLSVRSLNLTNFLAYVKYILTTNVFYSLDEFLNVSL